MNVLENVDGLSECIGRAIQDHLARSNINLAWPQLDSLRRPVLRIEAFLEDGRPTNGSRPRSNKVASVRFQFIRVRQTIAQLRLYSISSSAY